MEDLDSYTKSATVAVENDRSRSSTHYNKLTISFQPLAEDISKHCDLATTQHGFIIKAQQMLCHSAFLQLFSAFASDSNNLFKTLHMLPKNLQTHKHTYLYIFFQSQDLLQLDVQKLSSIKVWMNLKWKLRTNQGLQISHITLN